MSLSRRSLLRMAGAAGVATGAAVLLGGAPAAASQTGWRWCLQCEGLWFEVSYETQCPNPFYYDIGHTTALSGNYRLKFLDDGGVGQAGWRWCYGCSGLFFSEAGTPTGICPVDGWTVHQTLGSGNYVLEQPGWADNPNWYQDGWRYCWLCRGLFFSPDGQPRGYCPFKINYGTGPHEATYSGNYCLRSA